jgi:thiosulfate dehydrogenase [quinone] large subunit
MHDPESIQFPEPKLSRFLFGDSRMGWIWLLIRLYVGYEWIMAGWAKFTNPAWTGAQAGTALTGFLQGALQKVGGAHPDVSGWYGWFLANIAVPHAAILSHLVVYGELLVGAGLILGAFTGIAAFFGAFMNLNYLFAGTVSINPFLLTIQLLLILAWRNAGWIGLDRFLLPWLGVPWHPGKVTTGYKRR